MNPEQLEGAVTGHAGDRRSHPQAHMCTTRGFIVQRGVTEGNWNVAVLGLGMGCAPQSGLAPGARALGCSHPLPADFGWRLLPGH